jgi:nitrate reductase gamma subunit
MNALIALVGVALLVLFAWLGSGASGLNYLFTVIMPYAGFAVLILGVIWRVVRWARIPVPFNITTTCGQEKSLPWIEHNALDCPHSRAGALGRMALEILLFRSLFRNTKAAFTGDKRLVYGASKYLWLGAIVFHYCFLIVLLRHLRFSIEPVPAFVAFIEQWDGFFQVWLPGIYLTSFGLLLGLLYLLWRRLADAQVRFMSLASDYFALFLLLGIAVSGGLLRYAPGVRTDIVAVKEMAIGWLTFQPTVLEGASPAFTIHLFLVTVLMAYFPFSKLVHAPGVFFSPTRNLPNNNRMERHVNPWEDEIPNKMHTYAEWEEEFAKVIKSAGLPLEREHEHAKPE